MKLSLNHRLRQLTFNKPQWRTLLTIAELIINIWSRGTGKTYHQAIKILILVHVMPRGLFALVGRTLDQMMENTLPFVMASLETLGYYEWNGKHGHYVLGKTPPDHWPKPYAKRIKYNKCMTWYTGASFMLISQERAGSGRGPSFDAVIADEALTLKHDHLTREVLAANRGPSKWAYTPYHHSVELWSSKPYVGIGDWLNKHAEYYQLEFDSDVLERNNKMAQLMLEFVDSTSRTEQEEMWIDISAHLMANPYKVSSAGVYYNEAVVFENIENLGWKYIKQLRTSLPDHEFKVEVLNMGINVVGDKFYTLNDALQYDPPSYYENHGIHLPSQSITPYHLDTDVVRTEALDIACDANSSISTIVTGQQVEDEYRVLNGLYVKKPKLIKHLAQHWCDYYQHHSKKHVNFFFDHTFVYVDAGRDVSFKDQIIQVLHANGWTVSEYYIGQAAGHHTRYEIVNQHFMGMEDRTPVKFNRSRAKDVWTALDSTLIRIVNGQVKKDKRPEGNANIKQEHAPHFTDAVDTLIFGRLVQNNSVRESSSEDFSGLN